MANPDALADALVQRRAMLDEVDAIQATVATLVFVAQVYDLDDATHRAELDAVRDRVAVVRVAILDEIQTIIARLAPRHRLTADEAIVIVSAWLDVLAQCLALEHEINLRQAGHFSEAEIVAWLEDQRIQLVAWRSTTLDELAPKIAAAAHEPW